MPREAVLNTIHEVGKKNNFNTKKHEPEIDELLQQPAVTRLFEMADEARQGDQTWATEGRERLVMVLTTVQGLTRHIQDRIKQANLPADELVTRATKALEFAITGNPIV